MIVLVDGVEYRLIQPESERALEEAVQANHKHIFGSESLYFDLKRKLRSKAGIASIPDGYVIIFDPKPRWCILEVELASHPLYEHVVSQLSKFNRGIENSSARRDIVELLYNEIKNDLVVEAQVKRKIKSGEIYKFVSDMVSEDPVIVVAIDEQTPELEEALKDIRGEKKVVEFRMYQRTTVSDPVHAYVFTPVVAPERSVAESTRVYPALGRAKQPRPAITDTALPVGLTLQNVYKGHEFRAEVVEGNQIRFNGQVFPSLSAAAVAAIRSTGSPRETEDGWRWWRYADPQTGEMKLVDDRRHPPSK